MHNFKAALIYHYLKNTLFSLKIIKKNKFMKTIGQFGWRSMMEAKIMM